MEDARKPTTEQKKAPPAPRQPAAPRPAADERAYTAPADRAMRQDRGDYKGR